MCAVCCPMQMDKVLTNWFKIYLNKPRQCDCIYIYILYVYTNVNRF